MTTTTTTASNMNDWHAKAAAAAGQCPYLTEEETEDLLHEWTAQAQSSCPAFAGGNTCPFAQASSKKERQDVWLHQIPSSHWEGSLKGWLEQVHKKKTNTTNHDCPVVSKRLQSQVLASSSTYSFSHALEEYSLAAIMAKLAQEYEEEEENEKTSLSSEEEEVIAAVAASSTKMPRAASMRASTAASHRRSSLSQALQEGTAVAHKQAEDVHFVKNFIRGKIDRQLYAQLIWNLYWIYRTLEEGLDQVAAEHFPTCHFPHELYRRTALAQDVEFWWQIDVPELEAGHAQPDHFVGRGPLPSPATQDYCRRLRAMAKHFPVGLLAHAYTRYLGDLSGGKVLARVAKRALHLTGASDVSGGPGVDGLAFYHFEHVPSFKVFKDRYRQALNDLPLQDDPTTVDRLVQEANVAFGLNVRVFEELDVQGGVPGASVRSLERILGVARLSLVAGHDHVEDDEAAECPFLKRNSSTTTTTTAPTNVAHGGQCPWPFILLHDPQTGLAQWQTWAVIGLVLAWMVHVYA